MEHGWRESRDPGPYFSVSYYYLTNPELPAGLNPVIHYMMNGGLASEKRTHPDYFDGIPISFNPRTAFYSVKLPVTSTESQALTSSSLTIAVHAHCYYEDVVPQLASALRAIPHIDTLFVTFPYSRQDLERTIRHNFNLPNVKRLEVDAVPNRGRDIGPLLVQLDKRLRNFDLVLHIHTKKSVDGPGFGAEWLNDILHKMLFNQTYVGNILRMFERNSLLGIVAPMPYWRVRPFMVWGANKRSARRLLGRLGLAADFVDGELPPFPASSMFWFRPCALAPLFDARLQWSDFEPEPIGDDGSLAHSIERCFCHIAGTEGYQSKFVEPLNYEYCWPARLARKVSVIIPAYNAIEWLPLTLHSVLSQSSPAAPFEIVIVDNASTDGTLEFARDFQSCYDNVVVVQETTKGAGAARNAGIQSSSGEYITFVDSDDLLTSNALQLLYDAAVLTKVDVVTSSLVVFDEEGYGPLIPFNFENQVIVADKGRHVDQVDVWKAIFSDFGPCAKLYRKEWIVGNGINFPEQRNFEDNAFVIDVYLKAKRIAVLSLPTYLYRRYRKRIGLTQSTSLSLDSLQDQIAIFNSLVKKHKLRAEDSLEGVLYECLLKKLQQEVQRFGFGQTTKTGDTLSDLGAWLRSLGCQFECGPLFSDLSKKTAA